MLDLKISVQYCKENTKIIPSKIIINRKNFDPKIYNLDSKLLKTGFKPKKKLLMQLKKLKIITRREN